MTLSRFLFYRSSRIRNGLALFMALAFLVASAPPVFAAGGQNGNINGQVVDATTNAPIPNARISVVAPAGKYQATTDAQGRFSILGAVVDTYTISIQAQGYEPISQAGVTVIGDQNLSLGQIKTSKVLRTIGRTSVRSVSSAFQPNQTTDSITVNEGRIIQSTGKAASTNENALLLSVPGATVDSNNRITIRGSLENEVGYQLDGINFTEPFFSTNASTNRFSGLQQVQVVEGAGDATQGNVGGGVVNLIPKRGTYPATGLLDAEIGAPNQYNQGAIEYGFATPDSRISNYLAYYQTNSRYSYGSTPGINAAQYGNYFANTRNVNSDLTENFVFKFGREGRQSLQLLYKNQSFRDYGPYGGVVYGGSNPTQYFQTDPFTFAPLNLDTAVGGAANLASILPNLPGQIVGQAPTAEQQQIFNNLDYLKLEYDNQIDSKNFLDFRLYNWNVLQGTTNYIGQAPAQNPGYNSTGGRRSGIQTDFIHQFTPNYTFTFRTELENQHPVWDGYQPYNLAQLMTGTPGTDGSGATVTNPNTAGSGQSPSLADFLQPVNGVCPVAGGCYLSQFFTNGNVPKLPVSGINYNSSLFQTFALAIRNQIVVRDRLRLDLGARYDGAIYRFGPNPFNTNPADLNNPSDVDPTLLGNKSINPRTIDPRAAASYQFGRNDSIRVGYGRSTTFLNAQTAGTPAGLYNAAPLTNVPAFDTAANPACGSGTNRGSVPGGAPIFFKCANYAQQLYWLYDQNFDAPDLGGATAQVASNYDLTYQHQFSNGFGVRLTPFYKLSTGLPSFALLSEKLDPVTGTILSEVFVANNQGINRTTGVEFGATTPQRAVGFDAFLSATYQNVLTSSPPLINGEANLPIISSGSLSLGNVYRAGYVSPFVARIGAEYKTRSGLRINPVFQYDRGYPFNVGTTTASRNPVANGAFANIPSSNVGAGRTTIPGFQGATGGANSSTFVDPALPGNAFNPNIAATRGAPDSPSTGGVLYHSNFSTDLTVELKRGRSTFGVQASNLFGTGYYGVIPTVNPYYQPVSTGVAGPQTSQPKQASPAFGGGIYQNRGYANIPSDANAFTNASYLLTPTNLVPANPTQFNFYYQLAL